MSKVSFRARALDVTKPMPIYRSEEIPDLRDFDKINRAVLQMPTGMEKEEETETHLQKALTAQQFYGTAEVRAIPIPEVQSVEERYNKMYAPDFKLPKQYIHIQALGMEQEIPDYDLDSEDESWLGEQSKKMEITPIKFEEMMDRLEKGSGQQVVTLPEAKVLLKDDDDLIIAVYDYWLNKRLRLEQPLIPTVKCEKRDGTTTNNPYVAFRRRTEKMQTRKNRKNDETSYEKMLKVKRDFDKADILSNFVKRREKSKKEILQLTLEIVEKRYQMGDYDGSLLSEAEAERKKMPAFIPPYIFNSRGQTLPAFNGEEVPPVRRKRPYKRRQKQTQPTHPHHPHAAAAAMATAASFGDVDIVHHDMDSSDEDLLSPALSPSDHEDENDPDGPFAFKRRKLCHYYAPLSGRLGNWPWCAPEDGGRGDSRHRFSLAALPGGRCIGYARRRVGRGGRVILDRGFTPWDEALEKIDLPAGQAYSGRHGDYITYIREKKIPYFRPRTPPAEEDSLDGDGWLSHHPSVTPRSSSPAPEWNAESFHCHREQLLEMHRAQEARLLTQDFVPSTPAVPALPASAGHNLHHSFCSQPTSRFTLDSASAEFAVRAVMDSAQLKTVVVKTEEGVGVAAPPVSSTSSSVNCVVMVTSGGGSNGVADGQRAAFAVASDAAVTIPSQSLVSSLSSVSSSSSVTTVALAAVTVSTQPPVMATRLLTLPTVQAPSSSLVSARAPLVPPTSLLPLVSQAAQRVTTNGPIAATTIPFTSTLVDGKTSGLSPATSVLHLHLPITTATVPRAVVPAPAVVPSPCPVPTPSSTLTPVCAASGKVVSAPGMCNLATSSPINILKPSHEEGSSSVHRFNADTPMAMDVS